MDAAETDALVEAQFWSYQEVSPEETFSAADLCRFHKKWLGRIYDFAGSYRSVNVSKGQILFSPAYLVAQNMLDLEATALAAYTPCRAETLDDLARQLAIVHAELILVHPFREGNGRLGRWLANLMALQAGFGMADFGFTGKGSLHRRSAYIAAMGSAFSKRDYSPLATIFLDALRRGEQSAHP